MRSISVWSRHYSVVNLSIFKTPNDLENGVDKDLETWFEQGNQQYGDGDLQGAIYSYDQALKIKPDSLQVWRKRGLALEKMGRSEEAITSYSQALNFGKAQLRQSNPELNQKLVTTQANTKNPKVLPHKLLSRFPEKVILN